MVTIFLVDGGDEERQEIRISLPYSITDNAKLNGVKGAYWHSESNCWRAPLHRLDAVLALFGDNAAVAPEVFLAAEPRLPVEHFADTCAAAYVKLEIVGEGVVGSGGAWTPVLQREIDRRAVALTRLIKSGWRPAQPAPVAPPPKPASYDQIQHLDRVMAKGEPNWYRRALQEERLKQRARLSRKRKRSPEEDMQLALLHLLD